MQIEEGAPAQAPKVSRTFEKQTPGNSNPSLLLPVLFTWSFLRIDKYCTVQTGKTTLPRFKIYFYLC